ncbi:MAG TPA: isoprenylcysteine carboxylmethyltransferase family protein [Candidatus Acidoferrales bacterium]|nr:isoprenylcysteine carboxylmethyltransferase family protein [Candidatus Acidoferrales bacterium]
MAGPRAFVFRNRRWLIAAVFVIGFGVYSLDRTSVAAALAAVLSSHAGGNWHFWMHALVGLAAALVAVGSFWRTWGSAYLGADVVFDRQLHAERLLADGPYRFTRNPLYFGNLLFTMGLGFVVSPVGWPVLVIGMWVLVKLLIRDEEAGLVAAQGDSYRAYLAAVPRLFPSFRPLVPPAGARPRWLQGICGEAMIWAVACVTVGFAITLNPAWYQQRMLWAVAIALPPVVWARRRRSGTAAPAAASPTAPPASGH